MSDYHNFWNNKVYSLSSFFVSLAETSLKMAQHYVEILYIFCQKAQRLILPANGKNIYRRITNRISDSPCWRQQELRWKVKCM